LTQSYYEKRIIKLGRPSVTIYIVPGPNITGERKKNILGGWDYALKSIEYISELNPLTKFEIVFAHAQEFGEIPVMPKFSNIKFYIYSVSKFNLELKFVDNPSSQHGGLLDFVLNKHVLSTEFYAILDPDCYLLQHNTFDQLINHMITYDVDIIGISYPHTASKVYYWDFPTAFFQLMDSRSCPVGKLIFLPDETTFKTNERAYGNTIFSKMQQKYKYLKIKRNILKVLKFFFKSNILASIFLSNLSRNIVYAGQDLMRDTGWMNRKTLSHLKVEVIPNLVISEIVQSNFNSNSYLNHNEDLRVSEVDPTWHFLSNGIYENRSFGTQKFWYALLIKLFNKYNFDPAIYPASNLVSGESIFNLLSLPANVVYPRSVSEYQWKGEPFCIHLGHSGKTNSFQDMVNLDILKNHLILLAGGKL
jgi:hypothetical protein